jgi:hypothetical protein
LWSGYVGCWACLMILYKVSIYSQTDFFYSCQKLVTRPTLEQSYWPRLTTLFWKAFCVLAKKKRSKSINNSQHKTHAKYSKLRSPLCHIIILLQPKNKKYPLNSFIKRTHYIFSFAF